MLTNLSIKNYALIASLDIDFQEAFSVITGETGAGKSILLGALGLALGKRADTSYLKNADTKCVIEASFNIEAYKLEKWFLSKDLDFETNTIIRRELSPNGKSRAFINDTPTTLSILQELSKKLIDIHSQNQTGQLSNLDYQFYILDAFAKNQKFLDSYKKGMILYKEASKELRLFLTAKEKAVADFSYDKHLYDELKDAKLKEGELEQLEIELERLSNSEQIQQSLAENVHIASSEMNGLLEQLRISSNNLQSIASFHDTYATLFDRTESVSIEMQDIVSELERILESSEFDTDNIQQISDRISTIEDLKKKHQAHSVTELLAKMSVLEEKVSMIENASEAEQDLRDKLTVIEEGLNSLATKIHDKRLKHIPVFCKKIESILADLGMASSTLQLELTKTETFYENGKDQLSFLIATNKGAAFKEIKKVASGGEMSRIMLAIKNILSDKIHLPTIIFDEIDTGVSGEIASKMGEIMANMSKHMQVFSITHLPQVAAKGNTHLQVYKTEDTLQTYTNIKVLNEEERIQEIASMLGTKDYSSAAVDHARELLQ